MEAFWKGLEATSIALSFVVAMFAYVADRFKNSARKAEERKQRWQSGVIHQLLQNYITSPVKFDQILQKYRSESLVAPDTVKKTDLSEEALRAILIGLQDKGVISQLGEDRYLLRTNDEVRENMMRLFSDEKFPLTLMAQIMPLMGASVTAATIEQKLFGAISGALLEEPDHYGIAELALKLSKQENVEPEKVRTCIHTMIAKSFVVEKLGHKLALSRQLSMAAVERAG